MIPAVPGTHHSAAQYHRSVYRAFDSSNRLDDIRRDAKAPDLLAAPRIGFTIELAPF